MRKKFDEPLCPPEEPCTDEDEDVKQAIQKLLHKESFAVLSTQKDGQPYASLISFTSTADLKYLVFSTTKETRKYTLLENSPQVALLVDDRSQKPPLINHISAVTITGKATILTDKKEWGPLLLKKHPYLQEFLESPGTALILVKVYRFFYVRRFQEVSQWTP